MARPSKKARPLRTAAWRADRRAGEFAPPNHQLAMTAAIINGTPTRLLKRVSASSEGVSPARPLIQVVAVISRVVSLAIMATIMSGPGRFQRDAGLACPAVIRLSPSCHHAKRHPLTPPSLCHRARKRLAHEIDVSLIVQLTA